MIVWFASSRLTTHRKMPEKNRHKKYEIREEETGKCGKLFVALNGVFFRDLSWLKLPCFHWCWKREISLIAEASTGAFLWFFPIPKSPQHRTEKCYLHNGPMVNWRWPALELQVKWMNLALNSFERVKLWYGYFRRHDRFNPCEEQKRTERRSQKGTRKNPVKMWKFSVGPRLTIHKQHKSVERARVRREWGKFVRVR